MVCESNWVFMGDGVETVRRLALAASGRQRSKNVPKYYNKRSIKPGLNHLARNFSHA